MSPTEHTKSSAENIALVAAILLLAALGYAVMPVISPFVLAGGILYLLYPFRDRIVARRLMVLSAFTFVLWFLYSILALLTPFILAFLIAYILNPLVSRLESRRVPRWVSSLLLVLLLIGLMVGVMLFVLPVAIQQFQGIISGVALIVEDVAVYLKSGRVFELLAGFGIPVNEAQEFITKQLSPRLENILKTLFEGMFGFVTGISSLALHVINAIIVPFLVFYVLMDFSVITQGFVAVIPHARRERFVGRALKVDTLMEKYLRGAIVVALIQGTISAIALWIIGVNYALVLGIMTGILNFIPYVGLITSLVVSSIVAVFSGGSILAKIIAVVALYLGQKLLEATVLGPKIVGSQVGLHPVLLILCLMVFGYFLGLVGMLIAVPVSALILAAGKEWQESRRTGERPTQTASE